MRQRRPLLSSIIGGLRWDYLSDEENKEIKAGMNLKAFRWIKKHGTTMSRKCPSPALDLPTWTRDGHRPVPRHIGWSATCSTCSPSRCLQGRGRLQPRRLVEGRGTDLVGGGQTWQAEGQRAQLARLLAARQEHREARGLSALDNSKTDRPKNKKGLPAFNRAVHEDPPRTTTTSPSLTRTA